jgi:hypothetical protein
MRTLIEQMQSKTTQQPRNQPCKPFIDQGSYCWTHGYAVTKTTQATRVAQKDQGTRMKQRATIQWEEASEANNNRDKLGQSVHATILTLKKPFVTLINPHPPRNQMLFLIPAPLGITYYWIPRANTSNP